MRRIALCGLFVLGFLALGMAQRYTVTEIGALTGHNESSGFWINSLGEVVGCSDVQTVEGYPCTGTIAGQRAFFWSRSGGIRNLGTLFGGNISGAIGINDAGAVVGYSNVKGQPATNFTPFLWTSSGNMVSLGNLPGGSSGAAFSINNSGVITGDSFSSSGIVFATSWTNKQIKNLGRLPNAVFTAGLGINDSGEIAGESVLSYGPPFKSRGFVWKLGSGMKNLGTLPGGMSSIANAINTTGITVGQSDGSSTGGNWHAAMWDTNSNLKDLGTLVSGTYSIAFGINDSNTVVGYGDTFNGATHAMIWTQSEGMRDLNSLIPSNSGWELINANAINKLGQITGYGVIGGHNHGFLLTPSN